MKNISVVVVIYNEEKRIEDFIKSFLWSDDLIIVDKSSTDTTKDIIKKYPEVKLVEVPYSDNGGYNLKKGLELSQNEWIMTVTASDVIHPKLVDKLLILVNQEHFDYDVISMPYAMYVFGIRGVKRSPWTKFNEEWLYRKSALKTSNLVHFEMSHNSTKIYVFDQSEEENLYHLTHENMDSFMERHTRYARLELDKFPDEKTALKKSIRELLSSLRTVIFKRKSFLDGYDGIALGLAYISYFILMYLFAWEKYRNKGPKEYANIRANIISLWDERSAKQ